MNLNYRYINHHQFSWYQPKPTLVEGHDAPSLDAAWEYFEHMTLSRYVSNGNEARGNFKKATPGAKEKTKLYPLFAPEQELADLGLGVGIYFRTVRLICIIFLVAFLINLPLYQYFSSGKYSDSQDNLPFSLHGSAACEKQVWQPCPSCVKEDWSYFPVADNRYAEAESNTELKFIKVNKCELDASRGIFSWLACVFVLFFFIIVDQTRKKMEVELDELEQTATDYSVTVANPPKDARDPEGR